ncbi:divergent PAP2 family protein [Ammoniphilus resinae]|uniref:Acid phosphatase family membrane protein YuiD n=1 Tax=Ammoniphilus resinae TaxID=861532 RepID=A0ABS4GUA8_9BACL|nr:divergent PAP2 family protein [Ammoniphilus resinae]MBP1933856.1 acid phosphatase family membrane protein YuiD [Ammoniphilus resinae]
MSLLENYPLWASLASIGIAQAIKVPLHFITHRTWQWGLLFSTGGMPSSHSAAVTGLATAIGMTEGFHSAFFALSVVFAVIVMFDAAGVRRHAGEHAALLNSLLEDFRSLQEDLKHFRIKPFREQNRQKLKELLGHQPAEVLVGGSVGIIMALALSTCFDL